MHQQAMESKRELTRVWHPENLRNTSHHRFQSFPVQVHQRVQVQVWVLNGSANQTRQLTQSNAGPGRVESLGANADVHTP